VDFLRPHEHLNQVERWKLERHPLEVRDAIIERYSKEGAESIASVAGEQERLKWAGLYPQRQGGDAFMLRLKVPAGKMNAAQAKAVGLIAAELAIGPEPSPVWGDAYLDITTRQDIQMHWLRIEDIPEVWRRLEEVGLTTVQACGDSARNVLGCPVAGVDAEEAFDAGPVAQAISDYFTGNREYANLPRKFKVSVTGCLDDCAQAEINDIGLWPARTAEGALGFNVLVGGGLSDGPRMASDIDVFIRPEQAVELTRAIAQLYGELGNRENRGVCRMRYLVQELGAEGFRAELAARASFPLSTAGDSLTRRYRGDHVGVHAQKQPGLSYVGLSVTVGRMAGTDLVEAARLAATYGDGDVRLSTDQNLVLSGVRNEALDDLLAEPLLARYSPNPKAFERGVVACTGSEFCRFALVETKARAVEWARELDRRVQLAPGEVVRMHFSGCPASCAQPQIADIGFRGDIAHVGESIVEAVDIGLGGSLGADASFVDWVDGARPVSEVSEALVRLVERFCGDRREGEAFHEWCRRLDGSDLRSTLAGTVDR
jgi:ferredoxin-nitrite reductase